MPSYDLDDNVKHLVTLMATGLLDRSVEPIWAVLEGDDDISAIWGAGPELAEEISAGRFGIAELSVLADSGFVKQTAQDSYTLRRQQILDAYYADFEDPVDADLEQRQKDLLCAVVEAIDASPDG